MKLLLIVAALCLAQTIAASVYSNGARKGEGGNENFLYKIGGHTYFLGDRDRHSMTATKAAKFCKDMNMTLISFPGDSELGPVQWNLIYDFLLQESHLNADYWSSGKYDKTTWTWQWHTKYGTVPFYSAAWGDIQPDSTSFVEEDCVWFYGASRTVLGDWFDDDCNSVHKVVFCE